MPRFTYSGEYSPPAPVLPIAVGRPQDAGVVLVPALVDTGADLTVLPADVVAQLRLPHTGRAAVAGFDELRRILPLCTADIRLAGATFTVEAAAHGTVALVGRDLLNRLDVHLDGPGGALDVHLPRRA